MLWIAPLSERCELLRNSLERSGTIYHGRRSSGPRCSAVAADGSAGPPCPLGEAIVEGRCGTEYLDGKKELVYTAPVQNAHADERSAGRAPIE